MMANTVNKIETTEKAKQDEGKSIDEHLSDAGVRGFLQVTIHVVMMCYVPLTVAGQVVLSFFSGYNPSWKCALNSTSEFCVGNSNATIGSTSDLFKERCHLNRSEWTFATS